jgi:putative addiction module killer protein
MTHVRTGQVRHLRHLVSWPARCSGQGLGIAARLDRVADGNFGDVKPVDHAISDLRIDYGPGYRVYFIQRGSVLVVVLAGGDKRTQHADIQTARRIASDWERES